MSDEEEDECPECPAGLPGWLATFGDLMALLMSFFVLLLSFSEMDALKFKRLAGSMRNAFGVQNQISVNDIPKGTSIIAQEFSPSIPTPTPLNIIRQDTVNDLKDSLEVMCQDQMIQQNDAQGESGKQSREITVADKQQTQEEVEEEAERISTILAEAIGEGLLQVETELNVIIIRIKEQSFGAGTDYVADDFLPVLDQIRKVLVETQGDLFVDGHTDDRPINSSKFRSNWALSSARALAVAEYLFEADELSENRFTIVGHGSTDPLQDNETAEGRSVNRRVEIMIKKKVDGSDLDSESEGEDMEFSPRSAFDLAPDEIF
ncbi:MotB family protein [Marinicellulosiphila megalodicopiae]|uniref:MotB family protein n=1 Tax=Marinicellulosiphila megalodicopiae TaxID=2724896 RepID=UPI003BB0C4E5